VKIVSAAEMRAIDRATSERFGVASLTLMENAGSAVARFIVAEYPQAERIGIVCGKGNNGGDGFVAARKLAETGRAARVLLLADPAELRGDAAAMFERMTSHRITSDGSMSTGLNAPLVVLDAAELDSPDAAEIFASDVVVDAVLGTGFRPPVSPLYAAAIAKMNASGVPIIAVDIPSGADADSFGPSRLADRNVRATQPQQGIIARADGVVTFTAPRPAHVFAALTHGPTLISPIGSPAEAIVSDLGLHLSTPSDFAALLAPRALEANKGSYGHALIIGGSVGKAGAAAMAGFAALRAGAGLSTIATPKSLLATVAGFHPEVMTEPLAETTDGTISLRALDSTLASLLERKTAVAIGPGISRNAETAKFVRALVKQGAVKPRSAKLKSAKRRSIKPAANPENTVIVLDADALNAFEGAANQLNGRGRSIVITPHPGEMSRLTGLTIAEIQANRLEVVRKFSREHELIVVLKGHRTLTAAPDGTVWVNSTGNPGMATGGTGDVLTGMVAGLIAQHPQRVLEATALAVYLHGLAGDLAAKALGEQSLVATDLVRFLPNSFLKASQSDSAEFCLRA
jgi:ADP-dependent NAD(P)H-hydrate dehydratase / NAD(P)H-hydrate epimerase